MQRFSPRPPPALILPPFLFLAFALAACVSADPAVVARAVNATLTAVPTPTPIVVVVTALGGQNMPIPTVTPDLSVQQTLVAATQTLAAASATPPPAASPTPGPAATLAASPMPSATAGPAVPVGAVIFEDDFTQPPLWDTGEDDLQRIALADGHLSITLKVADRFTLVYNAKRRASNFYAAVTGTTAACHFRDRYGLLFRVQDVSNYYQLEVDCDGRYRLAKVVGGTLTPLKDWTASDAIRLGSGAVNELGVRAAGGALEVFANGQSLWMASDTAYAEGSFGLYAGSGVSNAFTAVFDNLRVWELQK